VLNPDLVVDIPPTRRSEREYALGVLLGEWLGLRYTVRVIEGLDETRIHPASTPDATRIAIPDVLLAPSTAWLSPGSLPPAVLPTLELPAWTGHAGTLPLLYDGGAGQGDLVHEDGARLVLRPDLLGSLVFMLARYEEHVVPSPHDEHGRFPARSSILGPSGWIAWPILDMYLHVLAAVARRAWPGARIAPAEGRGVIVGHDVDHPSSSARWHGRERLRKLGGDVLHRRDLGLAMRRASAFLPGAGAVSRLDPYNTYDFLMSASEAAAVSSTFFFLAREPEVPHGSTYRLSDHWAARLLADIAARGHHVGLHGSYGSSTDAGRLRREWTILEDACRDLPRGTLRRTIRQHYLRQEAGKTWRAQAEAGLEEDQSLGFADEIGYRAGTARSFPAYDLLERRQLALRIRPLHVMDGTLLDYLALDEERAFTEVTTMSRRTQEYGGDFSILWHNSSLETGRARRLYLDLLHELTA
jgi:peptidoglycan/xylan/chitin deacetylase (PgdA/CDA1 family)